MNIGDLVRYDPKVFREPTLSEKQERPFGWLKDDYEGTEPTWIGIISQVDTTMWGNRYCHKQDSGLGYEVMWSHGIREKVYAFEIEQVLDKLTK
jgi:hypothetical protein